jgi:2-polyprenyl-3-methyl-5-hydroxy-6-metoxy-1,4-benzoquinol methylase
MKSIKECCICNSCDFEEYLKIDHRNIVKCRECGHVFAKEYSIDELNKIYVSEYYSSSTDPRIEQWIMENKLVWEGLVKSIGRYKRIKTLCDIGSGTGGFLLEYYKKYPNVELFAIESSKEARKSLQDKLPLLSFIADSAEGLDTTEKKFDAITLFQTLEHVSDPKDICTSIYNQLNDNGVFFITIPNINSYKILLKRDTHCFPNQTHLHFFNSRNLKYLLKQCGFKSSKRIIDYGGSNTKGISKNFQFIARGLGISTEIRYIAIK